MPAKRSSLALLSALVSVASSCLYLGPFPEHVSCRNQSLPSSRRVAVRRVVMRVDRSLPVIAQGPAKNSAPATYLVGGVFLLDRSRANSNGGAARELRIARTAHRLQHTCGQGDQARALWEDHSQKSLSHPEEAQEDLRSPGSNCARNFFQPGIGFSEASSFLP